MASAMSPNTEKMCGLTDLWTLASWGGQKQADQDNNNSNNDSINKNNTNTSNKHKNSINNNNINSNNHNTSNKQVRTTTTTATAATTTPATSENTSNNNTKLKPATSRPGKEVTGHKSATPTAQYATSTTTTRKERKRTADRALPAYSPPGSPAGLACTHHIETRCRRPGPCWCHQPGRPLQCRPAGAANTQNTPRVSTQQVRNKPYWSVGYQTSLGKLYTYTPSTLMLNQFKTSWIKLI